MFGGVATGVANAAEAAIAIAIKTAFGSACKDYAIEMPNGANRAAVAVLFMNCVRTLLKRYIAAQTINGFGLSPNQPTTVSAINLPAPD